jgi:hypothetical protein
VLTNSANKNPVSIAFYIEKNSGMMRDDQGDLAAFAAAADRLTLEPPMRRLEERLRGTLAMC